MTRQRETMHREEGPRDLKSMWGIGLRVERFTYQLAGETVAVHAILREALGRREGERGGERWRERWRERERETGRERKREWRWCEDPKPRSCEDSHVSIFRPQASQRRMSVAHAMTSSLSCNLHILSSTTCPLSLSSPYPLIPLSPFPLIPSAHCPLVPQSLISSNLCRNWVAAAML